MLPSFAPFPPASVRKNISHGNWKSCLECWTLLAQASLLLCSKDFFPRVAKEQSLVDFIISYMTESAQSSCYYESNVEKEKILRREIFLLTHRIFIEVVPVPLKVLQHGFLGDFSIVYNRYGTTKSLLESLWDRENFEENSTMRDNKNSLIRLLGYSHQAPVMEVDRALLRTVAMLRVSFQYGQFLMLGSDVLDALATAFEKGSPAYRSKIMIIGYFSLICLLETRRPRIPTLLDHLYSLQSAYLSSSLLRNIASSTPLLRQLREKLSGHELDRAQPLMQELQAFENTATRRPKNRLPSKANKGKDKALNRAPLNDMHVHKMSLVTQIQDLFPDLGSAFIVQLLEEYDDDTEQVVAHLLEDSLPNHVEQTDRAENL
jgi:activating signal cointegrator complex subunit 2